MSIEDNTNSGENAMPPVEPTSLPPLPWKEGIEVVLARYERRILDHALAQSGNVKRRAAMLLGISRYALERRLTRVARTLDKADAPVEAPRPDQSQQQASSATGDA